MVYVVATINSKQASLFFTRYLCQNEFGVLTLGNPNQSPPQAPAPLYHKPFWTPNQVPPPSLSRILSTLLLASISRKDSNAFLTPTLQACPQLILFFFCNFQGSNKASNLPQVSTRSSAFSSLFFFVCRYRLSQYIYPIAIVVARSRTPFRLPLLPIHHSPLHVPHFRHACRCFFGLGS